MRSPPLVPQGFDIDVYVVLDDFGPPFGRAYCEVDEDRCGRQSVIRGLLNAQYNNPSRIVRFNTAQGTSRDVTEEIAREINDWAHRKGEELSPGLQEFIERELDRAMA
jgi:hypothetical protein